MIAEDYTYFKRGENVQTQKSEYLFSIRPCNAQDLDSVREICIETSSLPLKNEKDRRFLLLMYCDSYIIYNSDCFAAVDGEGKLVGYILCAADTREYLRNFHKNIMPKISRLGFKYSVTAKGICLAYRLTIPLAKAHLHIDLTASARRKGVGTQLMNTLKKHLAQQGINRVQLSCGSKNNAAIGFYKSNGFKTVFRGFGSCVMRGNTEL